MDSQYCYDIRSLLQATPNQKSFDGRWLVAEVDVLLHDFAGASLREDLIPKRLSIGASQSTRAHACKQTRQPLGLRSKDKRSSWRRSLRTKRGQSTGSDSEAAPPPHRRQSLSTSSPRRLRHVSGICSGVNECQANPTALPKGIPAYRTPC